MRSIERMGRLSELARFLRYFTLAVLGMISILIATVRIQQWMLRHRTEQLLADIQQVELRKTTFEDAQSLFVRWRKWGRNEGECTSRRCLFKITFQDFWDSHASLRNRPLLGSVYTALGGRPSEVYAGINVIEGAVWEKWFGFGAGSMNASHGEISTVAWLPAADKRFALHPDRRVDSNLPHCENVSVQVTPYEDAVEVRRLEKFNLSALTHWGFGPDKSDVMPAACAEARNEAHLIADVHNEPPAYELPRDESLEYLARDATRVAVVRILDKHNENGEWRFKARFEVPLKRSSTREAAGVQELHPLCADVSSVPDIKVGAFYLAFTDDPDAVNIICGGIVPATDENLAIARRGIAQDYEAVFSEANVGPRGAYGPNTVDTGASPR